MILTLILSLIIGLLLGLLGGGGSILTVPMLVYLLHVAPKQAILTSFVVVGTSSLIALIPHARRGFVCWKSGLFFGMAGMAGAFCGGLLAAHFSEVLLMSLFGLVSLITSILMLCKKKSQSNHTETLRACPLKLPYLKLLFDGFLVGGLTGTVGVGGGFLIVPTLTLWVGLKMQAAIGTSLLIIVMNALAGLTGYSQHVDLNLNLTLIITSMALIGSMIGAWLSAYIKSELLQKGFGLMVFMVAIYILSQSLTLEFLTAMIHAIR